MARQITSYSHPAPVSTQEPDTAPGPYYVSIMDGDRYAFLLGPFATHIEALELVEPARAKALDVSYSEAVWAAFGTARVRDEYDKPGRLNDLMGIKPTYTSALSKEVRHAGTTDGGV